MKMKTGRKGKKYNTKAERTEYCKGYVNKNGQWENGFPCPKWGPPDQNYCCGNEDERYCCPKPSTLEPEISINFPVLLGSILVSAVLGITTLILMCLYCRCCWGYKKRKNAFQGHSNGGNPSSTGALSEFTINYSACPHQSYFNDRRNHLPMYPLDDPPPYPGDPLSHEQKMNLGLHEISTIQRPSTSATNIVQHSNENSNLSQNINISLSASVIDPSNYGTLNCNLHKRNECVNNTTKHSLVYENFNTSTSKNESTKLKSLSPSCSSNVRTILTPSSSLRTEGISFENLFPRNRLSSEVEYSKYDGKSKCYIAELPSKSLSTIPSNHSSSAALPKLYCNVSPQDEDLALEDDIKRTLNALTSQSSIGLSKFSGGSEYFIGQSHKSNDVWCRRNYLDRNDTDETYFSDTDDKSIQMNSCIGKRLSESHLNDQIKNSPSNRHVVKNSKKPSNPSKMFIDPKQYHLKTDRL